MNTFKMNVYGWSGECSIHTIPWDMYFYLHKMEERGEDVSSQLTDLVTEDLSYFPQIREWLNPPHKRQSNVFILDDRPDWYWHEGDILCGIRPTSISSVEVNGEEYDPTGIYHFPFPKREIVDFEQNPNLIGDNLEQCWIPTIGFCAYEKGYAGGYTIETTDKVFDINKVTVDVIESSYSTFIDGFYYDGVLMDTVDDPEGNGKHIEVSYGCIRKASVEKSSSTGYPNWRAA